MSSALAAGCYKIEFIRLGGEMLQDRTNLLKVVVKNSAPSDHPGTIDYLSAQLKGFNGQAQSRNVGAKSNAIIRIAREAEGIAGWT